MGEEATEVGEGLYVLLLAGWCREGVVVYCAGVGLEERRNVALWMSASCVRNGSWCGEGLRSLVKAGLRPLCSSWR